jgi:hypothetical protein
MPLCPLFGRYREESGHNSEILKPTRLTQLRHSVTLRAPHECADTYYLMSGRKVSVPPDRLVAMTVEDSKPLLSIGWTTQNNLEIRETELMASRPIHD